MTRKKKNYDRYKTLGRQEFTYLRNFSNLLFMIHYMSPFMVIRCEKGLAPQANIHDTPVVVIRCEKGLAPNAFL